MLDNIKVENINKKPLPIIMIVGIAIFVLIMVFLVRMMFLAPTSPL